MDRKPKYRPLLIQPQEPASTTGDDESTEGGCAGWLARRSGWFLALGGGFSVLFLFATVAALGKITPLLVN
jgi:hypothetical protein